MAIYAELSSLSLLFFVSFLFYSNIYFKQLSHSPLFGSIIVCIIFQVLVHIFVFDSQVFYDSHWDTAHLIVFLSYFFPIFGVWGETLKLHRSAQAQVIELAKEMTERKLAEAATKREQVLGNAIIDSIPGAFYVLDERGRYVRWNAYQRDEIVGKSEDQVAGTNAADTIHPDDRVLIGSKIENVLRSGIEESVEGRVLLRGGPSFRWLLMTGRQTMIDGRPFLVGIGIDITERKLAEEALRDSEERHLNILHTAMDGFWMVDIQGRFMEVNEAYRRMSGYNEQELLTMSISDLEVAETPADTAAHMQKVMTQGEDRFETLHRRKDGSIFDLEISVQYKPTEGERLIVFLRDITYRKQAEKYLKSSLREKEVLLQEIQHRVKNNLLTISGILALQLNQIEDDKSKDAFITSMNRVNALTQIHTRLYQSEDFSRIDLEEYIEELVRELARSYGFPQEDVITDVRDASLDITTAIPAGLIVNELVSNAMKHAFPDGKKGQIKITISSEGTQSVLTVSDNGIGLPQHIDIRNTKSLRFSLVVQAVEQINGDIKVIRENGTQCIITFSVDQEKTS